ncbi:hypothetical protein [Mycobacterium sp. JS623]|uniref:hypothetical protein n=1 Tax=Mycobacterium sp. JS623 TaxID=212767 RepID=UPI0002DD7A72|nr:hypothetical protein [Mycobacterium sp. JS623]
MSRGTETRKLTEGVYVRLSPADYDVLRGEAQRRDVSIAQLLRDLTLPACRADREASVA